MNQNVLIQQKDGKKICNIDEHYGLLIIEFNPVIKTSHTGQIVTSGGEDDVSVQANFEKNDSMSVDFEDKISSHASMNSVDSNSDWLKDAPNDLEWMDQKAHLVDTANGSKKRRFRCKKRYKKRRIKNSKNWAQCGEKVGFQH
jgi:hypothetical protein